VAVNVTELPEHTDVLDAEIDTLTGRFAFTFIVIAFDVAGLPDGQVIFDVRTHVTTSSSAGVYVNVLLLVPESTPSTFH
jgi:hypothetical protein